MARADSLIPEDFPPLVYLIWKDAHYSPEEVPLDIIQELVVLHEVGWLVAESEESVTLSMEYQPGMDSTRLYLTVPRVNIQELYVLQPGVERARSKGKKNGGRSKKG
jgi:hypothetical protein